MNNDEVLEIAGRIDVARDEDVGALYDEIIGMLNRDADDHRLRFLFGSICHRALHKGVAKAVLEPLLRTHGHWGVLRMNYGLVLASLEEHEQALEQYRIASKDKTISGDILSGNVVSSLLNLGRYDEALAKSRAAIGMRDDKDVHVNVLINTAFAEICAGDVGRGWDYYEYALNTKHRKYVDFGVPEWNGEKDARLIVYPEQGLGDEIMYGGLLNELAGRVDAVAVECDPRLSLFFRRSFPSLVVYGSRKMKTARPWVIDFKPTHQLAMGSMPKFLRRTRESFGDGLSTYLSPNPALRDMYRTLIRTTAGTSPADESTIVGVAWSGGGPNTKERLREIPLEAFKPLIDKYQKATFVSLQYRRGAADEISLSGLPIQHHEFAVGQGASYDHTAAFIAACDRVISTDTTAIHVAGAMGIRTDCLLSTPCMWVHPPWHGNRSKWYLSVKLHRKPVKQEWNQFINHLTTQGIL